jgi:hypothetical protein
MTEANREAAATGEFPADVTTAPPPRRALWVLALYGILSLLMVPVFPHFPSPNEFSRWALTVSIVERGSLEVGPLTRLISDRIEDFAQVDGRLYSNKAPGGSLVAVPAYALARSLVGPPDRDNLRISMTLMRLGTCTIPLLMLGLAFIWQARRAGFAPDRIAFGLAALLFGTPVFAYGLLLFSHVLTATALFGAWLLLFGDSRLRQPTRDLAAGALLGLAAISEYPTAVPGAVVAICALRRRGLAGALRIAAGACPLVGVLALYNHAAFGSIFALSSSFERVADFRQLSQAGLWGVGLPSPAIGARLLLDPSKGLLVFSPVLLLALAAIPAARRRLAPAAFWSLVLAPLALLLVYAGYSNWHGGWTVGARYLVPGLPFLAYLLLCGRPRVLDSPLLGASAAAVVLTTLVFPFVSEAYAFPWASFATPLLAKGLVAPNLLHLVSRTAAVAIPFAIVAAALFLTFEPRRFLFTATGLAVWTMAGFLCVATWFPDSDGSRWYVDRIYFEQPGEPGEPPPPVDSQLLRRMQRDRLLPPSSWPF